EERERINQVVDLIPDGQKHPLSAVIKRLLSIKPRAHKNLASLLEGPFADETNLQAILTAAPDLVPIRGDRNRMLFDAAQVLQDLQRKSSHQRLAGSLREHTKGDQSGGLDEAREFLRQLDSLHGLGKKDEH
ncbi:MAG: hypothetical protein ABIH23_29300, partial [bacterium]